MPTYTSVGKMLLRNSKAFRNGKRKNHRNKQQLCTRVHVQGNQECRVNSTKITYIKVLSYQLFYLSYVFSVGHSYVMPLNFKEEFYLHQFVYFFLKPLMKMVQNIEHSTLCHAGQTSALHGSAVRDNQCGGGMPPIHPASLIVDLCCERSGYKLSLSFMCNEYL